MTTRFYSPGERRLLDSLPPREADVVRDFMEILDARLLPAHELARAPKRGETEQAAMRAQARQRLYDERRRLYDQQRIKPPLEFEL